MTKEQLEAEIKRLTVILERDFIRRVLYGHDPKPWFAGVSYPPPRKWPPVFEGEHRTDWRGLGIIALYG